MPPCSPYIFILCAEALANKIRENKDIEGITVGGNEIKISQYADDTTMILDGSKKSFTSALLDLELFGEISGLLLNSKKTEILWIGACAGPQDKLCPEKDLRENMRHMMKNQNFSYSSQRQPMVSLETWCDFFLEIFF